MKKIIARIGEGLGNQLFMYAHSYSLAKKNKFILEIDNESSYFKKKDTHSYLLNNFNITHNITSNENKFNSHTLNLKRKFLIFLDMFNKKKKFLIEKKFNNKSTKYITTDINKYKKKIFVEGHFECENYFSEFKNDLKNEFSLKNENTFKKNKYYDFIIKNKKNIISVCVRQNRFSERINNKNEISSINKSNLFVKETVDYIYRSISFLENKIKNPIYLVWSNDFSNLRNYFPSEKFTFIENENDKIISDFFLLSNCQNFIVSPTTFNWWPAWLNYESQNYILRPKNLNISSNENFWPSYWISI